MADSSPSGAIASVAMTSVRMLADRYRIGELLGRGGMAEVYAGTDTRLGRQVAVKLLRPALATDPSFRTRFRQEAQAAARMSHPTIVRVYDAGEQTVTDPDGRELQLPFIIMERVDGRLLSDLVANGPLDPAQAVRIVEGILTALEYSHQAGVVHLDIKPSNVMIAPTGQVKVMDFGIARAISDSSANLAQTSAILGTARYFSPEQARGELPDARTDLYSTGVVLYELLTGHPPFEADSPVAIAYQHVSEMAVPPSAVRPAVSPALSAVVMRSLEKGRDDRYQSALQFREELRIAASGKVPDGLSAADAFASTLFGVDPTSPQASAASLRRLAADGEERAPRTQTRPPVAWIWGALALVLVVVGAALYWVFTLNPVDLAGDSVAVEVPDVVGESFESVSQSIIELGLRIDDQTRADPTAQFPEGTIMETIPEAGTRVSPDFEVTVIISLGVPKEELAGLTYVKESTAIDRIEEAGMVYGSTRSTYSPSIPKGEVMGIQVEDSDEVITGTVSLAPGTTVNLVVSNGRVKVPDMVGEAVTTGRDSLAALQLDVRLVPDPDCSGQKITHQSITGDQPQRSSVELTYCAS